MLTQGYADQTAKVAKEPTLNERLNKAHDSLQFQCERFESVLSRINGTPQSKSPEGAAVPVRPTLPLTAIVDNLETINQRLANLASGVEKIA